ncbi:MAG: flagellar assembly protein FliW [Deltaproteobacteria bacterium]|jgi:flagellar assembly factor FliW|nr:flagellar assembly protein FliW [Deltaproteobacteria bacterium]
MAQEIEIMTRLGRHTIDPGKIIHFPRGLIGFEAHHDFTLLQIRPGSPFLLLQSMDDPQIGLLVADPYSFIPEYNLRVSSAEQAMLGIEHSGQVAILVTAGIPHGKPELATLNLTGPILINHERRLGLQVPQSDSAFPSRFRIHEDAKPVEAEAQPPSPPE